VSFPRLLSSFFSLCVILQDAWLPSWQEMDMNDAKAEQEEGTEEAQPRLEEV
jgi:hypothetical protein